MDLVKYLIDKVSKLLQVISKEVERRYPRHPYKTIAITHANRDHSCWWHLGSMGGKDVMQVVGEFLITNITSSENVRLSGALINKQKKKKGVVLILGAQGISSFDYIIAPHAVTEITVTFWVQPIVQNAGDSYVDDIAIVDNFGNEHWLNKCEFIYS